MTYSLIAAININGILAKDTSDKIEWGSRSDKRNFWRITKEAGVIVMGETTFKTLGSMPLPKRLNVVLTYDKTKENQENLLYWSDGIDSLDSELQNRGYEEVFVSGGNSVYIQYLQRKLISKMYLTTVPKIFTGDIKFLDGIDGEFQLKLVMSNVLKSGELFSEYDVIY